MNRSKFKHPVAGYIALGLMVLVTSLWAFWAARAMSYQGWWEAWYFRLPYIAPAVVALGLSTDEADMQASSMQAKPGCATLRLISGPSTLRRFAGRPPSHHKRKIDTRLR